MEGREDREYLTSTEGTNSLPSQSGLATCLLGNFECGSSSILVSLKLKVSAPRFLPILLRGCSGFQGLVEGIINLDFLC